MNIKDINYVINCDYRAGCGFTGVGERLLLSSLRTKCPKKYKKQLEFMEWFLANPEIIPMCASCSTQHGRNGVLVKVRYGDYVAIDLLDDGDVALQYDPYAFKMANFGGISNDKFDELVEKINENK